jgi:hypothetical protein
MGELLPARTEMRTKKRKLVAVVFDTVACHSYTTLTTPPGYRLGSLDLLIQMYYAMYFAELTEYLPVRLLCVIQELIHLEMKRRSAVARGKGEPHDVFPLDCVGHQPTVPELKKAYRARVAEKKPFDDAGKVVQNFFSPTLKSMDATKKVAESRIAEYQTRLQANNALLAKAAAERQRDEAARQAEAARSFEDKGADGAADLLLDAAVKTEAAADRLDRLASGPVADLVRSQGASGLASASSVWVFEIVDGHKLRRSLGVLGGYLTDAALESAIRGYVRACATDKLAPEAGILPGVVFRPDHKVIVR